MKDLRQQQEWQQLSPLSSGMISLCLGFSIDPRHYEYKQPFVENRM